MACRSPIRGFERFGVGHFGPPCRAFLCSFNLPVLNTHDSTGLLYILARLAIWNFLRSVTLSLSRYTLTAIVIIYYFLSNVYPNTCGPFNITCGMTWSRLKPIMVADLIGEREGPDGVLLHRMPFSQKRQLPARILPLQSHWKRICSDEHAKTF